MYGTVPPIEELKNIILNSLLPLRPYRIILFGSYAWGVPNEDSDIDIFVITSDEFISSSWQEGARLYLKYAMALRPLKRIIGVDLKVLTKQEYELAKQKGMSFFEKVMSEGVVIYDAEREGSGVVKSII